MILDEILKHSKKILENKKNNLSLEDLKNRIDNKIEDNLFEENLRKYDISFICEVKKASPSKGIICRDFDPVKIAKEYESAGASAISVLTEPKFFKGSDTYLSSVVEKVNLPVLRKDFIIDEYMIYESKLLGASAILLISSILNLNQLKNYIELSYNLNISPLVETHRLNDIKIAIDAGAKIIGINNRYLKDFTVDIKNTINLEKHIPKKMREKIILVSESGISTPEDVKILNDNNVDAVLIGESLMKSKDKKIAIENLKSLI
ncbi:MAG: indole-3-glycerol phosphate synthase TrpC [Methanobrevibacter sp.]|jgi:indole-3-glycerol phosphate synthase|nr:indole-3-glycerol phosphate synthase TrpC [Candidatus Methanovirga basalitermitum]